MILLLVLAGLVTQPPAQTTAEPPPVDGEVVVVGRPLADLAADWQTCIDRGCPPKVEMDRAMAYAEAQLSSGDYPGSWRTLRKTKQRNMKHADDLPLDVARIARGSSRMANLNGEPRLSRVNAFETVDALRAGLDTADARVLMAKLDIGDAYVPEYKYDFALAQYARVGREARKMGVAALYAEAEYRRASLLVSLSDEQPMYRSSARKAIAGILTSRDPAMRPYHDAARLTELNLLPDKKQYPAVAAMAPTLTPTPPGNLLLIWAPPIDFDKMVVDVPPREAAQQWLDIRYRVAPDGTVHDVAPARESKHLDHVLRTAAVRSLGERRYAPIAVAVGDPGPTRYARYTFVFDAASPTTGSQLRGRAGRPRADVFDLGSDLVRRD